MALEILDQPAQHPANGLGPFDEAFSLGGGDVMPTFEFVEQRTDLTIGASRYPRELCEFPATSPKESLGNIRRDGRQRITELVSGSGIAIQARPAQNRSDLIRECSRCLPDTQILEPFHSHCAPLWGQS